MKKKQLLTVKVAIALVILAVFAVGALFFTKLMPPINKTQASASPQTMTPLGAGAAARQTAARAVADSSEDKSKPAETDTSDTAVLGDSTEKSNSSSGCRKVTTAYKTVYKKVSWLEKGKQQLKTPGKNGYKLVCTESQKDGSLKPGLVIPPVDKVVYTGTGNPSPLGTVVKELQKLIDSID